MANFAERWMLDVGLFSLALRKTALVNLTHRIGFVVVELLRKIDDDLGGSTS